MDLQNEKCVMVIDEQLPIRIIANTAAVMGITLGKAMPEVVGADVRDESGHTHLGIIEFPVPILRGSPESIKALREKLYEPDFQALTVVDFSDLRRAARPMTSSSGGWPRCRRARCSISALPSAARRRRSTSSQAVSRSCGEPKKYLKITLDK